MWFWVIFAHIVQESLAYQPETHRKIEQFVTMNSTTLSLLDENPAMTTFMIILYTIIFVIGMLGNTLVVFIVVKDSDMHTVTYVYIACLSISDLLMCIFAIPFTPINALAESWKYGEFLCQLVPVIMTISVFVSTLTSVMIAIHRYVVIIHPHTNPMSRNVQILTIIVIWVISASTSVPVGAYMRLEPKANLATYDCHESWPNPEAVFVYTWLIFALQVVIPAAIITVCYVSIGVSLRRRAKNRYKKSCSSEHEKEEQNLTVKTRRINRMLISMIVIFIICWLPLDLIHLAQPYLDTKQFLTAFLFCHILAMSSVMYNPILYAWMNDHFRKHFGSLISGIISPCRRHLSDHSNSEDNTSLPTKNFTLSLEDGEAIMLEEKRSSPESLRATTEESQPMLPHESEDKSSQ